MKRALVTPPAKSEAVYPGGRFRLGGVWNLPVRSSAGTDSGTGRSSPEAVGEIGAGFAWATMGAEVGVAALVGMPGATVLGCEVGGTNADASVAAELAGEAQPAIPASTTATTIAAGPPLLTRLDCCCTSMFPFECPRPGCDRHVRRPQPGRGRLLEQLLRCDRKLPDAL